MKHKYTLLIYTENHIGLLNRISIIFTRHKVNIETLNTSASMHGDIHSFVITINTTADKAEHLRKTIEKQVEVLKALLYEDSQIIAQEVALYKISMQSIGKNNIIEQMVRNSNARILAVNPDFIVIEKTGNQSETQAFLEELSVYDVREFIRSGRVIVTKPMRMLDDILREMEQEEESN